jgi:hypothetical protein
MLDKSRGGETVPAPFRGSRPTWRLYFPYILLNLLDNILQMHKKPCFWAAAEIKAGTTGAMFSLCPLHHPRAHRLYFFDYVVDIASEVLRKRLK